MTTLTLEDKKTIAVSLGIDNLPEDKQEEIFTRLENIIISRLTSKVVDLLTDEDKKKIEEGDVSAIQNYIPNFNDVVKTVSVEVVEEFKSKLKG